MGRFSFLISGGFIGVDAGAGDGVTGLSSLLDFHINKSSHLEHLQFLVCFGTSKEEPQTAE
jgi:hypothetical protein